ncbi:MAG: plastocyanin/azurin family copper-binding protein [Chloroflexota bacterium]
MNRQRSTLLLAILASLVVLLAACSSQSASQTEEPAAESTPAAEAATEEPTAEPAADADAEVRIVNSVFQPGDLTISVGDEVLFTNDDTFAHTVTEGTDGDAVEDPIVDDEITGRGEVRVTFDEAGTYDITCEIHPSMQMTITVEG